MKNNKTKLGDIIVKPECKCMSNVISICVFYILLPIVTLSKPRTVMYKQANAMPA